jgi:signal recognition particle GTPase
MAESEAAIDPAWIDAGTWEVEVAGRREPAVASLRPLYDPEMKKIKRVAKPDLVCFVGDALAGSDAVEQAKRFDAAVGIDAVILTKIDADAKGGAALSIAKTIGKPIAYVSIGQEYDEFRKFDPDWMVERIFGDKQSMAADDL